MLPQKLIRGNLTSDVLRNYRKHIGDPTPGGCREWIGARKDSNGYGVMKLFGKLFLVHRIAWVMTNDRDIPDGMVIDHTCFNKSCVNPAHLECISQTLNVERYHAAKNPQSLCRRGHTHKRGTPCGECNAMRVAKWRAANPERARAIGRRYDEEQARINREYRAKCMNPSLMDC